MAAGRTRNDVPLVPAPPDAEDCALPRFAIDGHVFVAIPEKQWAAVHGKGRHGRKERTAGFVEIDGTRHVLIERPEFEGAAEGTPPISSVLTSRELQIAYSVADGKCDKVIAYDLGISEYTVREHMRRIFHKLKVSKRAAVVAHLIKSRFAISSSST
jgi:DNA-binding CsgD family transcriptional regulator